MLQAKEQTECGQGEVLQESKGDSSTELWGKERSREESGQPVLPSHPDKDSAARTSDHEQMSPPTPPPSSAPPGTPKDMKEKEVVESTQVKKAAKPVMKPFEIEETEVSPSVPLKPMEDVIGWRNEKYFIRKLFGRDRELYEQLIAQIEKATTWEIARHTMKRFWARYGIDGTSKLATRFSDVVRARYEP